MCEQALSPSASPVDPRKRRTRGARSARARQTTGRAAAQAFFDAGYGEQHILDVILAIAVKTISNDANHVFDTPLDNASRSHEWRGPATT